MNKTMFTVLLLLGLFQVILSQINTANLNPKVFEDFKKAHGKKYASTDEEKFRLGVFLKNKAKIDASNNDKTNTFKMAINSFADLTS